MPITRSKTGRDSRSVQATQQSELVSQAGPSEQSAASTTDATPSQYESSNTTGTGNTYSSNMTSTDSATDATPRTTSEETNTEEQTRIQIETVATIIEENALSVQPSNNYTPAGGAPPQRSNRTKSRKSQKSTRLSQAKEELLRLQIELATARIATIEAETDTDDDTITTNQETARRVNDWLDESHVEATIGKRQHKTEEKIGNAVLQENKNVPRHLPIAPAMTTKPQAVPPIAQALKFKSAQPPAQKPAGEAITVRQNVDIGELASAIALAARAGQNTAPRHFIELPTYSGAYQEWLSFRAAYTETANSYSVQENLARLRRSLRGRAKEAVENLLIYNTSPEEVLKALESRFGRPDAIALAELERLRALPRPSDTPRDLCVFANRVSNIVATLRALQKTYYLYNPEVTKATIEKLTPAMRYRWFDFAADSQTEEADLLKLTRFLQRESDRCGPYAQPESITDTAGHASTQRRPIAKTYATAPSLSTVLECPICNKQGHTSQTCPKLIEANVNDRWDIAKNKSLCFRCLKHRTRKHSCRGKPCDLEGCARLHHRLLHFTKKPQENKQTEVVNSTWARSQSFLKIVPVRVSGPKGDVNTYALLDDGSTVTLIDSETAQQIGAKGPLEPLRVEGIGNSEVNENKSRRVTLTVHGATDRHDIGARTLDNLQLATQRVTEKDLTGCEHIADIANQLKYRNATPKLLIGQDNWHLLLATDVRKGQQHQPVASLTPLGWVLHGAHTRTLGQRVHYVNNVIDIDTRLDEQLRQHFALESLTIEPKRPRSDVEERALTLLREHTKQRIDGRYETGLLWKSENINMPDNYDNAYKRLLSTERKIDKDSALKHAYEQQMNALVEKGYAERAPTHSTTNKTWYLPHFPVLNPMKPGKIRVVHDAAAKTKGMSLNDYLLTGPDLLQSLPGVLMRFRQHPIAVTADITEMFMQVKIRPEDRDALRYLWRGSERGDCPPKQYRMTSLIFGATSSPATAIFVKNENARKQEKIYPSAYEAIVRNHYVDDYLQSFVAQDEAIQIAREVRDIHREARYELRQWASNSPEVLRALGTATKQKQAIELNDGEKTERVLGLIWKPETDKLAFNLDLARLPPKLIDSTEPTKRDMLRVIMSLFDPLGFASLVTTRAKQILQETWRRGTGWDEKIDRDLAEQWQKWMNHLRALKNITIPRCHLNYSYASRRELHIFVDASESAYAAALYWRIITPDGNISVSLVLAKARVAPLKVTSIPRLELQAAVMGSRMAAAVTEEHDNKTDAKIFWTDSRTVLTWIKTGSRTYRPYVAHRIAAIEENSNVNEWRWVPTKLNVADDATRDVPYDLTTEHRWFQGPSFLREEPCLWPKEIPMPSIQTGEEKTCVAIEKTSSLRNSLPDHTRFSKWEKLLRSTARVLQFIAICKKKQEAVHYKRYRKKAEKDPTWRRVANKNAAKIATPQKKGYEIRYMCIDSDTLRKAEYLLIRSSQEESFAAEIKDIERGEKVSKNSRLRPLATEIVNGVITLATRIDAATTIDDRLKRPPVLDGNHNITRLYIEFVHRQLHHAGVETTINECRQQMWILRLRPTARAIIHRCLPCVKRRSAPPTPSTGNHPRCRLAHHVRPFTHTGLDYFGPLIITVGRTQQKRYVALFTCLTTRAIHLEIAASLSTDAAVMALRRMIARRGCPTEIWSDNGTNLQGAAKELRRTLDRATEEESSKRAINWRFIPPGAPFMGGAWERLVRSVKIALETAMHERHPTEEIFATLLAEVEYTVNSRPLTHVSVSPEDPEALTPNHFLLGGTARTPTPGTFNDADLIGRTHWRASQRLADLFWARWLREYLPSLQHRREPHGKGPTLRVGDVVLIVDGTLPRNTWPRGLITAVYPGPDGIVRTVDVRTKGGTLRRPTKKLVVLPTESPALPAVTGCVDQEDGARRE